MRQLKGKSFAAIKDATCFVDDRGWVSVLGNVVVVHGGGELRVDDHRLDEALEDIESEDPDYDLDAVLIPLVIDDPHYPKARVLMQYSDLVAQFNEITPGSGPHIAKGLTPCKSTSGRQRKMCACPRCFYDFWIKKASEEGIDVTK